MNEQRRLARFIYQTAVNDSAWFSIFGTRFREEIIPEGIVVTDPIAMFVGVSHEDLKGAFGYRLYTRSIFQIKGVVEGSDFSILGDCADYIDKLFDWQNQLIDGNGNPTTNPNAGRPRSQFLFIDPNDSSIQLQIMCMVRNSPIKYANFADGVNYCHLGGEYTIEYYIP